METTPTMKAFIFSINFCKIMSYFVLLFFSNLSSFRIFTTKLSNELNKKLGKLLTRVEREGFITVFSCPSLPSLIFSSTTQKVLSINSSPFFHPLSQCFMSFLSSTQVFCVNIAIIMQTLITPNERKMVSAIKQIVVFFNTISHYILNRTATKRDGGLLFFVCSYFYNKNRPNNQL